MNNIATTSLRAIIVVIGLATLALLIWFPLVEGRAKNLDWLSIYSDPFILYAYATSMIYFVALYKIFQFVGYIGQQQTFSAHAIKAVKNIKYCAILLCILIVVAALYIVTSHHKDDDPAGFLALCILTAFVGFVVAVAAAKFERIAQKRLEKKS